jgi:hypothetical protein
MKAALKPRRPQHAAITRKLANRPQVVLKTELKRKVGYDEEDQVVAATRKAVAALNLGDADGEIEEDIDVDQ